MSSRDATTTNAEIFWSLAIRVTIAVAIALVTVPYMVKHLDPTYASKKDAEKRAKKLIATLGLDPKIKLSEYEMQIATQLVCGMEDGADWSQLGGCDAVIEELQYRIILPLKLRASNSSRSELLSPPKGVLLYGPPGCGKTLLAKAVARAAGARFINLQVAILTDKWYGESQKLAAAVFSLAKKFQPTIVFIDEIDSFLRDRSSNDHEATAMMKAQFMSLWDGFTSSNDDIIVMGATNRPEDVDRAILRRMPARFHVAIPNTQSRAAILRVILSHEPIDDDIDFERVAQSAVNFSGSDLKEVCRLAVLRRAKDLVDTEDDIDVGDRAMQRRITENDLNESIRHYGQTINISRLTMFGTSSLD